MIAFCAVVMALTPVTCPPGESVQWIADYCMAKIGTDDEIAASECIDAEARIKFADACAAKLHYKRALCALVVKHGGREGTVDACVDDPRFKGRTVQDGGVGAAPVQLDLLFASSRDGNSEIYRLRPGQEAWINLSNHEASDNWPAWSPDGTRIVFQSKRAGNLDIWTMKADGTDQLQLTDDSEPDYLPSWSPDGKTITFTSWRKADGDAERAPHVYAMDADGGNERRLVRQSLNTSGGATWSPDGKRIVYERKGEKAADIYVADADGTNERRITHDGDKNVYSGSPTFSPDGKSIAFYADDEKASTIVIVSVDGKDRRTVVASGKNWYPRWSPDGRWLVYTASVAGGDEGNIDIFAVPVAGDGNPMLLIGSPKRDQEGSWRPK